MRLWLLRQAHPDLSKLELEVSTSCLSKISLLRLLLGQTNRDKDFPESLRYSVAEYKRKFPAGWIRNT